MKSPFWSEVRQGPAARCRRVEDSHRRIEHRDLAGTAQAAGKFHVLHQRDGREAAERAESFAPDENRLIAEKTAAVPGQKTRRLLRARAAADGARRICDKTRPPITPGSRRARRDGGDMGRGQNGIGVMKNEDVAGRAFRRPGSFARRGLAAARADKFRRPPAPLRPSPERAKRRPRSLRAAYSA